MWFCHLAPPCPICQIVTHMRCIQMPQRSSGEKKQDFWPPTVHFYFLFALFQYRREWFKSIRTGVTTSSKVSMFLVSPITSILSPRSRSISATAPIGNKNQNLVVCQNNDCISRNLLKGVIEKAVQYHSGAWQKIVFVVLADKSLRMENVFECVVKLPQTPYVVRRTMLYAPSKLKRYQDLKSKDDFSYSGNPMVMASASNACSPARSLCWLKALLWLTSLLIKCGLLRVSWPRSFIVI